MWKLRADMPLSEIRDRLLVDGYGYGGPDLERAQPKSDAVAAPIPEE
jgi:hypothetical protein